MSETERGLFNSYFLVYRWEHWRNVRGTQNKWRDEVLERGLLSRAPAITATVIKRFVRLFYPVLLKISSAWHSCAVNFRAPQGCSLTFNACTGRLLSPQYSRHQQWLSPDHLLFGVKAVENIFPVFDCLSQQPYSVVTFSYISSSCIISLFLFPHLLYSLHVQLPMSDFQCTESTDFQGS